MGLSHDRLPTPTLVPEVSPATVGHAAPNVRAAEFPAAHDDARLAAEDVLAADPLAGFFYDGLLAEPQLGVRDALFSAYINDWSGFNALLLTVDRAASAERALTTDPARVELLAGLRTGIAQGKLAYQQAPLDWELDVLLGMCDATRAPLTAAFITLAYDAERDSLARRLRDRAGEDPILADGATRLMTLLGGPETCAVGDEAGEPTGSWFDRGVDSLVDGHANIVDDVIEPTADVPGLGGWTRRGAASAKTGAQFAGGVAKGFGDLVGGIAHMVQNPIETTKGLLNLAEHIPGTRLKTAHKVFDVVTGHKAPAEALFADDRADDLAFWGHAGLGLAQPFLDAIEQGKPAEAAGRAAFDVGSMFIGAGELRAGGRLAAITRKFTTKADDVAKVGAEPTQALAHAKQSEALKATDELSTKTVWDSLDKLGPTLPDTQIPRWFEISAGGERYWVAPNATEHFEEYLTRGAMSHGMPMSSQAMLASFHAAVEAVVREGVRFDEMLIAGPWELKFAKPRAAGELPCIKHAMYRP